MQDRNPDMQDRHSCVTRHSYLTGLSSRHMETGNWRLREIKVVQILAVPRECTDSGLTDRDTRMIQKLSALAVAPYCSGLTRAQEESFGIPQQACELWKHCLASAYLFLSPWPRSVMRHSVLLHKQVVHVSLHGQAVHILLQHSHLALLELLVLLLDLGSSLQHLSGLLLLHLLALDILLPDCCLLCLYVALIGRLVCRNAIRNEEKAVQDVSKQN